MTVLQTVQKGDGMKLECTGEVECDSVRRNEQLECDSKLKTHLEVGE